MMLTLVAATVAAMPTVPANDAAARAAVAAYIARCSEEWAQQGVVAQPEVIKRCIADDYQGISVRGKLVTKADLLAPYMPKGKAAGVFYARPRFLSPEFVIVQGEEWFEPKDGSGNSCTR